MQALPRSDGRALRQGCLQSKIEARHGTRRNRWHVHLLMQGKAQPQIARIIPLEGHGLDTTVDLSRFRRTGTRALNANPVSFQQLPAPLFQGEAPVHLNLLERRRPATPPRTRLDPLEKR
jgi:hypothetical protein